MNFKRNNKSILSVDDDCLICYDAKADAVFMDCGHGGLCYDCAIDIWKNSKVCFLCRNKITQV